MTREKAVHLESIIDYDRGKAFSEKDDLSPANGGESLRVCTLREGKEGNDPSELFVPQGLKGPAASRKSDTSAERFRPAKRREFQQKSPIPKEEEETAFLHQKWCSKKSRGGKGGLARQKRGP